MLHSRAPSLEDLGRSAAAGRAVGGLFGFAGRQWAEGLTSQAKGRLGETLGAVRSAVNRMEREVGPKKLFKPAGAKTGTYPDGRSGDQFFEDKFGPRAALSKGQQLAQKVLGPNYTVFHFHPDDVAKLVTLPFTGVAPQVSNGPPQARAPRR